MHRFTTTQLFNDRHKDLIHHVAYDFHGKRIATCSSDQSVCVWDLNANGAWVCSSSWKAHNGPIWKVVWAHPEYGQVLATCSFDRSAHIFEEVVGDDDRRRTHSSKSMPTTHWQRRADLLDSRANLTDIKFAPRHLGLILATLSAQGSVRIYVAHDPTDLSLWPLEHEFSAMRCRCSALTWSQNRGQSSLIAVGCDDQNWSGPRVALFEYNDKTKKWQKCEIAEVAKIDQPVNDLSFAPALGRSFHILAIASTFLQIVQLKPLPLVDSQQATDPLNAVTQFQATTLTRQDDPSGQIWRLSWNVTGTILSTGSADGTISLYKQTLTNSWTRMECLRPTDQNGDSNASNIVIGQDPLHRYY